MQFVRVNLNVPPSQVLSVLVCKCIYMLVYVYHVRIYICPCVPVTVLVCAFSW